MQDERDVVRRRWHDGSPSDGAGRAGKGDGSRGVHVDGENPDAIAGGPPCLFEAVGRKDQDPRAGVFEVEAELFFRVRRVQRRRRARDRCGQDRHDHRQTVRQRDADAIAAPDAGGRELFRDGLHLVAQRAVADTEMVLGKNDRGLFGRAVFQQFEECGRCRHAFAIPLASVVPIEYFIIA